MNMFFFNPLSVCRRVTNRRFNKSIFRLLPSPVINAPPATQRTIIIRGRAGSAKPATELRRRITAPRGFSVRCGGVPSQKKGES